MILGQLFVLGADSLPFAQTKQSDEEKNKTNFNKRKLKLGAKQNYYDSGSEFCLVCTEKSNQS